ncbi:MAG: efflux RND transporter permease subunit [Rhodothermaceae bacterium]
MNLTQISINRPTIIVVIFIVLVTMGLYSYSLLNYELMPDIGSTNLTITTAYPGASPSEVENSVTKIIEDGVILTEDIETISSKSLEGLSIVRLEMNQGIDVDKSIEEVQRNINQILSKLPDDAKTPMIKRFNLDNLPVLRLGLFSKLSTTEFYDLIDRIIKPEISQITGVGEVDIVGGNEREIKINLNSQYLEKYNLDPAQIVQIIGRANLDYPTGKVESQTNTVNIRLSGKVKDVDLLENVILKYDNNTPVKLKDIAEVLDSQKETKLINRTNGQNSIGLTISKQTGTNSVELSKKIREKLHKLKIRFSKIEFDFKLAYDSSEFTLEAANAVQVDLMLAIILVATVILLFLHTLRNSLIVMISIPTSIVSTFIVMNIFGFSLNMMTLLALSLVIGILVDDSIVVLENIHRHLEMGKDRVRASYDGRMEIGFTALSITLVDIIVFVPITLATGMVATILFQYSIVIIASTLMSLFVSFTLVPFVSSRFAKIDHLNNKSLLGKIITSFDKVINLITNETLRFLKISLERKFVVLFSSFILLIGAVALIPAGLIGSEFLDAGDRGEFIIEIEAEKNTPLKETNQISLSVESVITVHPEVKSYYVSVGKNSIGNTGTSTSNYQSEISVQLVSKSEREISTEYFSRNLKLELEEKIPGVKIRVKTVNLLGSITTPVQIVLRGGDIKELTEFTEYVTALVDSTKGTIEVQSSIESGLPEYKIEIDRERLKKLGLSIATVGFNLQVAFNGNNTNKFRGIEKEYDINIKLDDFDRNSRRDIENFQFINNKGELIKLKQFAQITEGASPFQMERSNRISSLSVEAGVIGRKSGEVISELRKKIAAHGIPQGIDLEFIGQAKNQSRAFGTLGAALLISVFLIYLLMVVLYNSYIYPLVVLFSIPLSIIGALLALALTQHSLSVFSIVGIIMLIGLVAKNAILVVDFTNELINNGKEVKAAVLEAVKLRFRPILMTNLSMIIGLLPLAVAGGPGAEWKNGLAWALIGGLSSSMVLSLIVVPVVYLVMDNLKKKFGFDNRRKIYLSLENK